MNAAAGNVPISPCCMPVGQISCCPASEPSADPKEAAVPLSTDGMKLIPAGEFRMGDVGPEARWADGEGPVRDIELRAFWIDEHAVTNQQFARFVEATAYQTETERFGWSFVHHSQMTKFQRKKLAAFRVAGLEWWYRIDGADWRHPLGTGETVEKLRRLDHPAVHLTWHDASAYARWSGKRLATEAEWERACRGGLVGKLYPWGDDLTPGGKHRCNIWQGTFPTHDSGEDGYRGTAPARAFKPNDFGLCNMTGNVWEWVNDWFSPEYGKFSPRSNPPGPDSGDLRIMRGGSYLCHASYCNRYRCSARTGNTPDTSSGHLGFRCAANA